MLRVDVKLKLKHIIKNQNLPFVFCSHASASSLKLSTPPLTIPLDSSDDKETGNNWKQLLNS